MHKSEEDEIIENRFDNVIVNWRNKDDFGKKIIEMKENKRQQRVS
jgi:hypothetical protein